MASDGVSLLAGPPGSARPSSTIWLVTVAVPSVAPLGAERFTASVSAPSKVPSLAIATVIVCVVAPGAKVNVPVAAVKSVPDVALPFAVA